MWHRGFLSRLKRNRLYKKAPAGPLRDFYTAAQAEPNTPLAELEMVALDFETTGLDARVDHIVSIGLVHIRQCAIDLETCWHQLVYTERTMPEQSAIIHQITDDVVETGERISKLMPQLLDQLKGKVLLVHHADTEMKFLNAVCLALYGAGFTMPLVDTEALALRLLRRRQQAIKPGQLRLYNLCRYFHLPPYKAHNALYDAISTAELFLAIQSEICPKQDCRLRDVQTA
jgi:DNA polymerase-3 subunit epsilon